MSFLRNSIALLSISMVSMPTLAGTFVDTYTGAYTGNTWNGTVTFNDWGYTGPMGVGANDFAVAGGFDTDPARLGQIQSVQTVAADYATPDPLHGAPYMITDLSTPAPLSSNLPITDANMDGSVNFYKWGYTTPTSNFNNMQIDKAGNYFVAKSDMSFGFYDTFSYRNEGVAANPDIPGSTPGTTVDIDTGINFQPYAISDARGWCGSTMVSNPNGLNEMAGQVTFDFAFDAYLGDSTPGGGGYALTQIVPDFVMRSYGDYTVHSWSEDEFGNVIPGEDMTYSGSAVGNNTNPETGLLDPAYLNKVSFLGGGVVPAGAWVLNDGTPDVQIVTETTPGATWHANIFAGYAFLLRADANRTLEWISPTGHSDYVATVVPVPAAVWLFGSGLLGLIGVARRNRK